MFVSPEEFKRQSNLLTDHGYTKRMEGQRWLLLDPWFHVVSREFALKAIAEKLGKQKEAAS